jgi:hypothetical protein
MTQTDICANCGHPEAAHMKGQLKCWIGQKCPCTGFRPVESSKCERCGHEKYMHLLEDDPPACMVTLSEDDTTCDCHAFVRPAVDAGRVDDKERRAVMLHEAQAFVCSKTDTSFWSAVKDEQLYADHVAELITEFALNILDLKSASASTELTATKERLEDANEYRQQFVVVNSDFFERADHLALLAERAIRELGDTGLSSELRGAIFGLHGSIDGPRPLGNKFAFPTYDKSPRISEGG